MSSLPESYPDDDLQYFRQSLLDQLLSEIDFSKARTFDQWKELGFVVYTGQVGLKDKWGQRLFTSWQVYRMET